MNQIKLHWRALLSCSRTVWDAFQMQDKLVAGRANIVSGPRETIAACSSYIAKLRASPHATKSQPG